MFASVSNHFSDDGFAIPWVATIQEVIPPILPYVVPLAIVGITIAGLLMAYKVVFKKGD